MRSNLTVNQTAQQLRFAPAAGYLHVRLFSQATLGQFGILQQEK